MALFHDFVQGPGATAAAVANLVALDSLTLAQSARMITRISVTAAPVGTFAAAKPLVGYVKVKSDDCNIEPLFIPIEPVGTYITLGGGFIMPATKWIVNCPCPGGAVLDFEVVADAAPNAAPEVQVTVEYSDGASPFGGTQFHMKVAEPAVAQSTSDNGATNMTAIEVKSKNIVMIFGYATFVTAVADSSVVATAKVTSDDFAVAGPHKFSLNPSPGGDANLATTNIALTKIETAIPFRSPGQKQTVACEITMRDAVSTAPLANWGVVYE